MVEGHFSYSVLGFGFQGLEASQVFVIKYAWSFFAGVWWALLRVQVLLSGISKLVSSSVHCAYGGYVE